MARTTHRFFWPRLLLVAAVAALAGGVLPAEARGTPAAPTPFQGETSSIRVDAAGRVVARS